MRSNFATQADKATFTTDVLEIVTRGPLPSLSWVEAEMREKGWRAFRDFEGSLEECGFRIEQGRKKDGTPHRSMRIVAL